MSIAKKATMEDAKIKCMVWGDSGTGKSRFGLSAPSPLVIDTEDSTSLYSNEFDFFVGKIDATKKEQRNAVMLTATIIEEIEQGQYPQIKTLVVDCLTDILEEVESASATQYEKTLGGKTVLDLNAVQKTKWYAFRRNNIRRMIDRLKALPLNLILVCRSKDVWGQVQGKMQPIGKTYDAHELTEWLMDVVIKLDKKGKDITATVTKSRIGDLAETIEVTKGYQSIIEAVGKKATTTKTATKNEKEKSNENKV
ncbi:unnamed protein product [marine sediment metagenome]|uniref:Phage nucleotide-binding protein n=1 Tax=marine sediment metagenome TaxID=412755 RepID=X1BFM5_9ZZZZ